MCEPNDFLHCSLMPFWWQLQVKPKVEDVSFGWQQRDLYHSSNSVLNLTGSRAILEKACMNWRKSITTTSTVSSITTQEPNKWRSVASSSYSWHSETESHINCFGMDGPHKGSKKKWTEMITEMKNRKNWKCHLPFQAEDAQRKRKKQENLDQGICRNCGGIMGGFFKICM